MAKAKVVIEIDLNEETGDADILYEISSLTAGVIKITPAEMVYFCCKEILKDAVATHNDKVCQCIVDAYMTALTDVVNEPRDKNNVSKVHRANMEFIKKLGIKPHGEPPTRKNKKK